MNVKILKNTLDSYIGKGIHKNCYITNIINDYDIDKFGMECMNCSAFIDYTVCIFQRVIYMK